MSTALLDRADTDRGKWQAHAHIDKYAAGDEAELLHLLHPGEMVLLDRVKARNGGELPLLLPPGLVVPHISKAMFEAYGATVIGEVDEPGNLLANAGINRLGSLLIGGGGQAYDNTHCAIGAGDTNTAAAASQTDLAATVNAANRWFQVADATYPTFASQVLTVVATFATANGNFAWAEWAIAGNTASAAAAATAPLLNRKVAALGTKTSAAAWAFTVTITIS